MTDQELKDLIGSNILGMKELRESQAKTDEQMKKTDEQMKKRWKITSSSFNAKGM